MPSAMTVKHTDQPTLLKIVFRRKEGGSVHSHKREIATTLDLADFPAVTIKLQILELDIVVRLLAGPLERFGPGVVAEPIADEIGVALCIGR